MKPTKDRVVLKQHEAEKTTKSGIILPDQEKPNIATVVYIGPQVEELKVGDTVILGSKWYTNFKHPLTGEELLILNEPDIFGVINQ